MDKCYYWLILRKVESEAAYKRIGIVQHPDMNWKTNGKNETIRLV